MHMIVMERKRMNLPTDETNVINHKAGWLFFFFFFFLLFFFLVRDCAGIFYSPRGQCKVQGKGKGKVLSMRQRREEYHTHHFFFLVYVVYTVCRAVVA